MYRESTEISRLIYCEPGLFFFFWGGGGGGGGLLLEVKCVVCPIHGLFWYF